jgi:hypothetical protein
LEIIIAPPPYVVRNEPEKIDGLGDMTFLLKYRLLSANEQHGNYILTFFFSGTITTGEDSIGEASPIVTPTIAAGKGWGNFDIQSTFGAGLPIGQAQKVGRTLLWNTTFQYHLDHCFWPEIESNDTYHLNGDRGGLTQSFITPGLVFGRIHLYHRLGLTLGTGIEIAATHFHTSNHVWITSVRFPF